MKGMIDRFVLFAVSAVFQSSYSGKDRRMAQPLQYLERLLDLRMWYFDTLIVWSQKEFQYLFLSYFD